MIHSALNCVRDEEARRNNEISRQIDQELRQEKKRRENVRLTEVCYLTLNSAEQAPVYNLLLLGTGEAGKTTFVKQMRISNGNNFTAEDKLGYKINLINNVVDSIKVLIEGVELMEFQYEVKSECNTDSSM